MYNLHIMYFIFLKTKSIVKIRENKNSNLYRHKKHLFPYLNIRTFQHTIVTLIMCIVH